MALFIVLLIAFAALANGLKPQAQQLKDDYQIKAKGNSGHRLAGWQVLAPKNVKCDMVRRNIKKFGYCFIDENEQKGINTTQERGWIRDAVKQWEKCGGITIREESKCRKGPDFITINVGNYHPVVYPEIDKNTCTIYGFSMYTDFYTFGINIENFRRTEKIRKSNIQSYALHEFGHFLGFDHEQNRNDRTECQYEVDETEVGPNAIWANYHISKEYDIDSIMNYCRPNSWYKPWLSKIDKQAVAATYGGGNKAECDAVTKPLMWGPEDDLYDYTLTELFSEGLATSAGSSGNGNSGSGSSGGSDEPKECKDAASKEQCDGLLDRCTDEAMTYWCPKTCNLCH